MKYLIILAVFSFNLIADEPIKSFECGKYNQNLAKQLDPEKSYFKDSEHRHAVRTEAENSKLYEFIKNFRYDEEQLKIEINYKLANKIGAYVAFDFTFIDQKYGDAKSYLYEQQVVPHIQYKIPNGFLTGSNRGEFGGELLFFNKNFKTIKIANMNVEDIYKFDFGYIVTSGLAHMSSNFGSIYLVTFKNEAPKLTKLFALIAAPIVSWKINDKELLIKSGKIGSQILNKDGLLQRVHCTN